MSPLGLVTVTVQFPVPCEASPPGHEELVNGPPPELLTVKSKVVVTQGGGETSFPTGVRQLLSTTASSAVASLAFEQSPAVTALLIAVLNLTLAVLRHAVGSVPVAACIARHLSLPAAFLPIAAVFFESHVLATGLASLAPTAPSAALSQVSTKP
jgi:hypothetical protein